MARSFAIPSFAQMGATLAAYNGLTVVKKPAKFAVSNSQAADRYSEPMQIVHIAFEDRGERIINGVKWPHTGILRVTGEDGNVRSCIIERLPNFAAAQALSAKLKEAKNSTREIQFVAAGGNDANRWMYDIVG